MAVRYTESVVPEGSASRATLRAAEASNSIGRAVWSRTGKIILATLLVAGGGAGTVIAGIWDGSKISAGNIKDNNEGVVPDCVGFGCDANPDESQKVTPKPIITVNTTVAPVVPQVSVAPPAPAEATVTTIKMLEGFGAKFVVRSCYGDAADNDPYFQANWDKIVANPANAALGLNTDISIAGLNPNEVITC